MSARQAGTRNSIQRTAARSGSVAAACVGAALLAALPAAGAAAAPIKLAVFDFELEDFSAAASSAGETVSGTEPLARVTEEVRRLLAQSGRYRLVDVATADTPAAKARPLHKCDGCDAEIARELGADQSFVGVIQWISRTEYVVRFQIRDARTGAVVAGGNSGLRMGADYSWGRGATRLLEDRLLERQARQ
jgi:hypothetical protein